MAGPHKGLSTQCTTQQQPAKPRHQPSDRDQRARDRLRNKVSASQAKIRSPAYIALGATALQTVYQTFDPDLPVTLHLPALTTKSPTNTIPTLFVIQEDRYCYIVGLGPNCKFIDLLFKRSVLIFIKISSFIVSLFQKLFTVRQTHSQKN